MLNGFDNNFSRNDEEVLNEFRQKQVNFDLEERKNEINNSRSLFIGALAGLAMAGIVGWFILAPQYKDVKPEEVPVIRRPASAVKVQPLDTGAVDITTQENTVYDIIEKTPAETEVEKVLPLPEEPNIVAIETLIQEKVETVTEKVVEEPKKAEIKEAEPKKEEVKKEEPKPVTIKSGAWQVQLMSSPNKSAVDKSWAEMVKKHPVLANEPYEIEKADLGEKGIYYRLRVGNFAGKDGATALCNKLKESGGSCFVARK